MHQQWVSHRMDLPQRRWWPRSNPSRPANPRQGRAGCGVGNGTRGLSLWVQLGAGVTDPGELFLFFSNFSFPAQRLTPRLSALGKTNPPHLLSQTSPLNRTVTRFHLCLGRSFPPQTLGLNFLLSGSFPKFPVAASVSPGF